MAQVNSEPGKNQTSANVAVPPDVPEYGASASRASATATIVPYMQHEPGTTSDIVLRPKRS
jgi:hypothetical protein